MQAYLFTLCLMPLLALGTLCLVFRQKKNLSSLVALNYLIYLVTLNLLTYFKYGLLIHAIRVYSKKYYLVVVLVAFMASMSSLFILNWMSKRAYKLRLQRFLVLISLIISFTGFTYVHWLSHSSSTFNFEILLFNLKVPLNTTNANFYKDVLTIFLMPFLFALSLVVLVYFSGFVVPLKGTEAKLWHRGIQTVLSFMVIIAMLVSSFYTLDLPNLLTYLSEDDPFIANYYVTPSADKIHFPSKKRNLIIIFMESYESTYFDANNGGARDENLLPNITRYLQKGATNFSHRETGFGGMKIMPGATWSIAGMTAQLSGLPYKVPADPSGAFLPGIQSIGDLLLEQGYRNKLIVGTDASEYGVASFYSQHGQYEILDHPRAVSTGLLPDGYHVEWGFEDRKLYGFAQEALNEMSQSTEPFHLVLETSDTHFPDGYTDPGCARPYDRAYANSVACADALLGEFLDWLGTQDYYENTSIVVVGDHLSMDVTYFEGLSSYERTVFNMFINPMNQSPQINKRDFNAADIYPSILSSIGVVIDGDRLGLGTDLFSQTPTLFESLGIDFVQDALSKRSQFYDDAFMYDHE